VSCCTTGWSFCHADHRIFHACCGKGLLVCGLLGVGLVTRTRSMWVAPVRVSRYCTIIFRAVSAVVVLLSALLPPPARLVPAVWLRSCSRHSALAKWPSSTAPVRHRGHLGRFFSSLLPHCMFSRQLYSLMVLLEMSVHVSSKNRWPNNQINFEIVDRDLTGPNGRIVVYTSDRNWRDEFNDDDEHWCTDEEMCPEDDEYRISVYEMSQLTHDGMRCEFTAFCHSASAPP
jgi:hypothetical protein